MAHLARGSLHLRLLQATWSRRTDQRRQARWGKSKHMTTTRDSLIKEAREEMAVALRLRDLKTIKAATTFRRQMGDHEFTQLDDDAVRLQAELDAMPTALYRHFDSEGRLLYVGISLKAISRTMQHRTRALWYTQITRIEMTWFGSRSTAEAAERLAIKAESPLHNVTHNKKPEANLIP